MEASTDPRAGDGSQPAARTAAQTTYHVWVTRWELLGAARDAVEVEAEEVILPADFAELDLLYLGSKLAWDRDAAGRAIFDDFDPKAEAIDGDAAARRARIEKLLVRIDREETVTVLVGAKSAFGEVELYAEVERKLKSGRRS